MTILGKHTVAELRDLLNAYNYQQTELEKAWSGAASNWYAADNAGATQWKADYDGWNRSYQPARDRANTVLAQTSTTMQGLETDEDTYQALAKAFMPFADLDRVFRAGPVASAAPKYENNPQPEAHDADLGAFKTTDAGVAAMPQFVKSFVGNVAPQLAPENKDAGAYKPLSTMQKVLLGVGAFLGLAVFVKIAK